MHQKGFAAVAAVILTLALSLMPAVAWDSAKFKFLAKIIHPTHSYLTEYAIAALKPLRIAAKALKL